ncbi:unnamed protein product [Cochlearia groenlandica]
MINYIKLLIIIFVIIPMATTPVLVSTNKANCDKWTGTCIDRGENETSRTMTTENVLNRRILKAGRYISYNALKKNNVPCKRRGRSYYGCGKGKRANPYKRGCNVITHCYRFAS